MLDVDNAPAFLIDRGLIDRECILDGQLTVRSLTRRNRNLRVEGPGGGYLIKQPGAWEESSRATLGYEAAFHRFCRAEPGLSTLAELLPALILDDPDRSLLIFEAIPDALPLHHPSGVGLTEPAARALGRALGKLHRVTSLETWGARPRPAWLDRGLPWILDAHEPVPDLLATLGPATFELLRVLQASEDLLEPFRALSDRWRTDCVIHGDIRLDNILVRPDEEDRESGVPKLWIVDWEMVGVGDPAWDLAGALQDLLGAWIASMPMSDEIGIEQMVAQAAMPRELLHALARALWSGYREEACLDRAEGVAFLGRAVAFSAGRLVQTVFEGLDGLERLAGPSVPLLQVAANLLAEPERAQVQLYGIPLDTSGT